MTAAYAEPTYATDLTPAPTAPAVALVGQLQPVADTEEARSDRLAAAAQRRAAARTRDLSALLRDRPDLAGVHAPADFAVDAVRWCA
jgi:hypothetical protein